MSSLAGSIRAWDGRTRISTDEHRRNGERVWYFARASSVLNHGPFYLAGAGWVWDNSLGLELTGSGAGRTSEKGRISWIEWRP